MRKKLILRLGLVGVVAAASASSALAVGCSSDDNSGGGSTDSGADTTSFPDSMTADGPTTHDSAADTGEAAALPVHAKVTFVNAAADLAPVRICIGIGTPPMFVSGVYPLPNSLPTGSTLPFPAVFPGTGGPLPDITDLQSLVLSVYLIDATKITTDIASEANEPDCPALIGADGNGVDGGALVKGTDYFELPAPIPANTFTHGNSFLVALGGCGPGDTSAAAPARCGAGYTSTADNLSLQIYQLDNGTPAAATLNLQMLHASKAWDGLFPALVDGQPISNTFGIVDQTDGGDAAVNPPVATLVNYGAPVSPDAAAPQTINPVDYANLNAYVSVSAPDGGPLALGLSPDGGVLYGDYPVELSFPDIQALSGFATVADGGPADPLYLPGANFTLVWVGDPTQAPYVDPTTGDPVTDGGASIFNTSSPHFLMFPNNPVVPSE